ncbi:hypothetical protein ACHQM5_000981 [Ranunculus cassubicifolius]
MSLLRGKSWNLPQDITFDIFSRLSVKIVMRCRCVNKTWCAWLSNPHFISLHLTRASEDNDCSLLFTSITSPGSITKVKDGREISYIHFDYRVHLIESKHDLGIGHFSIPRLNILSFTRAASCNGLICSCHDFRTLILSNPFTRENLTFSGPIIPYEVNNVHVGLGYHRRSKEYKILCFSFGGIDQNSHISHLGVQTLGSGSWRSKGEVPIDMFFQQKKKKEEKKEERNARIFEEEKKEERKVIDHIKELVWNWNRNNSLVRDLFYDDVICKWSSLLRTEV